MENIKIAYMIQAHKDAKAINQLIGQLSCKDADFYVHIDKKSDIINQINKADNVCMIEDRVDVRWGHISQVEATLHLMNAVSNSNKKYDYVWLISGQDYPIKPNSYIHEFLGKDKKLNYIEVIPKGDERYLRYLKRNETWYPTWGASPKFVMRIVRKLYNYLTGGMMHSLIKRNNYLNADFQFGSSWFTITYEAMMYILHQVNEQPYLKYYKNCICPDESFFQTILWNSVYRDSIRDYLLYVDWSEHKKNPKDLGTEDYAKLKKSDKLIARKFVQPIDNKTLQLSREN